MQQLLQTRGVAEERLTSLVLALVVLVAFIGTIYLAQSSRTAAAGRRVQELETQRELLEQQNAQLRAEIAALRSVSRLREEAEEMGYREAAPDEVVYMELAAVPPRILPPEEEEDVTPLFEETLESWLFERLSNVRRNLQLLFEPPPEVEEDGTP